MNPCAMFVVKESFPCARAFKFCDVLLTEGGNFECVKTQHK
jgi:hypothetical protein